MELTENSLQNHQEDLQERTKDQLQRLHRYIQEEGLGNDLSYLQAVFLKRTAFQWKDVLPVIDRVKNALFGSLQGGELIIPEFFYRTPLGSMIRSLETGLLQERELTVTEIMAETGWSRPYVIRHLHDTNQGVLTEGMTHKMPAHRKGRSYVVRERDFQAWYQQFFQKRKGTNL